MNLAAKVFRPVLARSIAFSCAIALSFSIKASAQSVTTIPLGPLTVCAGSSITVSYTASGSFGAKNVFTVQISDPSGSFSPSFQNIGSVKSTTSGSITVTLPSAPGSHYRVRVASSNPYIVGNDNGSDLAVVGLPDSTFHGSGLTNILLTGTIIHFSASDSTRLRYAWNFGAGASPATSTDSAADVTYATPGFKTIQLTTTSPAGCSASSTATNGLYVFSCNPSIPANAFIDSVDGGDAQIPAGSTIWVVPGGSFKGSGQYDTIYAEAGTSVSRAEGSVVYLKPGATYDGSYGGGILIYAPGAGVSNARSFTLECPSLAFNYSNAPPYKITWAGVEQHAGTAAAPRVYPDPATNTIYFESVGDASYISIRNLTGDEVMREIGPFAASRIAVDVHKLPSGIYYANIVREGKSTSIKFAISR